MAAKQSCSELFIFPSQGGEASFFSDPSGFPLGPAGFVCLVTSVQISHAVFSVQEFRSTCLNI